MYPTWHARLFYNKVYPVCQKHSSVLKDSFSLLSHLIPLHEWDRIKWKLAFQNIWNVYIQIVLCIQTVTTGPLHLVVIHFKLEMYPKNTDVRAWTKVLTPEKKTETPIANAISDTGRYGWTDIGKTICPFHHSSNGGVIITELFSKPVDRTWLDCTHSHAGLGLCCQHMPGDTFSLNATYVTLNCRIAW